MTFLRKVPAEIFCINRNILECKLMTGIHLSGIFSVLIETYWNVKSTRSSNITALTSGINRNILECKGAYLICIPFCVYCINRNILECKVIHTKRPFTVFTVLIETYWNVKLFLASLLTAGRAVLIETYWNVKLFQQIFHVCH